MSVHAAAHRAIDAVWRIEAPCLLGGLVRLTRDLDHAEDAAQDALLAALRHWPESGIPRNPGAWLMTVARRRAIDQARARSLAAAREPALAHHLAAPPEPETESPELETQDDVLRLLLIACHPVLSPEARTALTLRLIAGLSTAEIARAYLVPEPTLAQRIVRAKRTLAEARVPFELPDPSALPARLPAVRDVIYLIFNEGYSASAGESWTRPALCAEAQRLARLLAAHAPAEPESHGLLALLELQAARLPARIGQGGEPVLLLDQDRARWDRLLIHRGLAALARAEQLAQPSGPYTLQAAIAACHARAPRAEETDWARIVALYDALAALTGSPVVELNRAVAIGMAYGPAEALALADELALDPALRNYPYLPAVRGDLLEKLGRAAEAQAEFTRAGALTGNAAERAQLESRAARTAGRPGG